MLDHLNGATRIHYIVGDPIAQVKSPSDVTRALVAQGRNALVVPAHVAPAQLRAWVAGVSLAQNVDSIIVTVPHKFACFDLCSSTTEHAAFLRAVNTMRRGPDGGWHGDMGDGPGMLRALQDKGYEPKGKSALLAGAGGAGSAIAHSLALAGVSRLAIHDTDAQRRQALVERLAALGLCPVTHGSADPTGFDLVVNATTAGMQADDPYPIDVTRLQPGTMAACAITAPPVSPFLVAARERGCASVTGGEMFGRVKELIVEFLLGR
ncbi:shikimate dehydrogenase [Hydrogenophaga sp.]|uniref:shikimate dehydrogenase family protein n=1 Tax=Hydrogenophaga sp. TaxID=1904254 RepID=UPI00262686B4|nr:shikimate dehydrogenase [Hydrogenophaga sp.]MCW5652639.1 shikimate dehydrogenase [Hydrogenophaga sp.]